MQSLCHNDRVGAAMTGGVPGEAIAKGAVSSSWSTPSLLDWISASAP
jgi:hypothetical protein